MLFNQLALTLCLFLLFAIRLSLVGAARRGDRPQVRVLHFFRLGLALSAFSHLFRILGGPPTSPFAVLGFVLCFAGTALIMVGWLKQRDLMRERTRAATPPQEEKLVPPLLTAEVGLPVLDRQLQTVLQHAREEARHRRQCCLDTDHLLLGLLREPGSAGADILDRLSISRGNIRLALGQPTETERLPSPALPSVQPADTQALPLTDRARRALVLAGQEAHRFDTPAVGTDHLLLGLVLMGKGAAAATLFREGLTVEEIRVQVLKSRPRG